MAMGGEVESALEQCQELEIKNKSVEWWRIVVKVGEWGAPALVAQGTL